MKNLLNFSQKKKPIKKKIIETKSRINRKLQRKIIKTFIIHLLLLFNARIMTQGKKAKAEKILLSLLDYLQQSTRKFWDFTLIKGLINICPFLIIKTVKRGGRLKIPFPITGKKQLSIGLSWLIKDSKKVKYSKKDMSIRLGKQIILASTGKGPLVKKKLEVHKLGAKGKSVQSFRW